MATTAAHSGLHELDVAEVWWAEGRRFAMATVVETWGSAPRPVGSHLLVDEAGNFEGSVSGGCVEGAVIVEAEAAMRDGTPRLLDFGVADETAWRVGLSCGGRISVLVQPMTDLPGGAGPLVPVLNEARRGRRPATLATDIATGRATLLRGDDAVQDELGRAMALRLAEGKSGPLDVGGSRFMVSAYAPATRMVLLGAVHITQALAPMATLAGLEVVIVDPRQAFATPDRFPGTKLMALWPHEALPEIGLDPFTALAALTHDPKIDDPAIEAALTAGCFYVGALGSAKTHRRRLERLRARGWTDERLTTVRAPIGLDIGARSPGEIAVAVLAEIIKGMTTRAAEAVEAAT